MQIIILSMLCIKEFLTVLAKKSIWLITIRTRFYCSLFFASRWSYLVITLLQKVIGIPPVLLVFLLSNLSSSVINPPQLHYYFHSVIPFIFYLASSWADCNSTCASNSTCYGADYDGATCQLLIGPNGNQPAVPEIYADANFNLTGRLCMMCKFHSIVA